MSQLLPIITFLGPRLKSLGINPIIISTMTISILYPTKRKWIAKNRLESLSKNINNTYLA